MEYLVETEFWLDEGGTDIERTEFTDLQEALNELKKYKNSRLLLVLGVN